MDEGRHPVAKDKTASLPEESRVAPLDDGVVPSAVVGAHLTGMPLNHELTGPGGCRLKTCRTAGDYRLFVLPNSVPPKTGLIREPGFAGNGLEVEVWALPPAAFSNFVQRVPGPLGIGKVTLEDGTSISGFLCEAHAVAAAEEVTALGGLRAYVGTKMASCKPEERQWRLQIRLFVFSAKDSSLEPKPSA